MISQPTNHSRRQTLFGFSSILIGSFNSQRLSADWVVIFGCVYMPPVAFAARFFCPLRVWPRTAPVSRGGGGGHGGKRLSVCASSAVSHNTELSPCRGASFCPPKCTHAHARRSGQRVAACLCAVLSAQTNAFRGSATSHFCLSADFCFITESLESKFSACS